MATYSETGLVAVTTAAVCLSASVFAVSFAPPVYESTIDTKFVLAYHDKRPGFLAAAVVIGLLYLSAVRAQPRFVRIGIGVFVGGVIAQIIAGVAWAEGVPDYLHFFGVIANAADVAILASALVLIISPIVRRKIH